MVVFGAINQLLIVPVAPVLLKFALIKASAAPLYASNGPPPATLGPCVQPVTPTGTLLFVINQPLGKEVILSKFSVKA